MSTYSPQRLEKLVTELLKLPHETEWLEVKHNDDDPQEIGEYISALANSAAHCERSHAYLIWGVEDGTHAVLGTTFHPQKARKGNEELESWLLRQLSPKIAFRFYMLTLQGQPLVLLEIKAAQHQIVSFSGIEYIRIGSYKKKLHAYTEIERKLWRFFDKTPFEAEVASAHCSDDEVLKLLDYSAFFELLDAQLPPTRSAILASLEEHDLIKGDDAAEYSITNLGAILFARKLQDFPTLERKQLRIILYTGSSRIRTSKEQVEEKGYAAAFETIISTIKTMTPSTEVIESALRHQSGTYPDLAIRELVANALIHQDFSLTGTGPIVELFDNRIEISNPGTPLVEADRFLNAAPRSRNEALASLMRRLNICEERGSGIDKIVFETEFYQLPAPLFEVSEGSTRITLFSHRSLSQMDRADRIRACYLHACLKYVSREYLTNTSVRERFKIEEQNSAMASRFIKEAVTAGKICLFDSDTSRRLAKYVPYWAREEGAYLSDSGLL